MAGLNCESRQSIYFGINYILASGWVSDKKKLLDFQNALLKSQLDFSDTKLGTRNFILLRKEPSPLQVKVASLGPQVSNIIINSERPAYGLDLFAKEADAICNAYKQTWLDSPCQILRCDATLRHLYSCEEHAFKYLWENRLGQKPQDFHYLGKRPVLGGGLRLVMPAIKGEIEPVHIEIKIESFFQESEKMFIETLFLWPQPRLLSKNKRFDPEIRLTKVEKYAMSEVWNFILQPEREE